ncbi:MAG: hypothetical protein WBY47_18455, partial [Desulfobacterales bacterium]
MDDAISLIQCPRKDVHQDEIQEECDEPPSILLPLTHLHPKPQEAAIPRKAAVVLPFAARRQPKTSCKTRTFRRKFFPAATDKEWNNWHWQINNRIHSILQLGRFLDLSSQETDALGNLSVKLPLGITPYYMSLISREDPD